MKNRFLTLALLAFSFVVLSASASFSETNIRALLKAVFSWENTEHDFGKIKVNKPVTHTFSFENKGNTALVISSVKASCGCTVADYSDEPVEPGSTGFVRATYNAAKAGTFVKTISVVSNADQGNILLTIKGEVVTQ